MWWKTKFNYYLCRPPRATERDIVMIYLNLKQELNNWAYMQLTNAGFNNVKPAEAMSQYYDVELRFINPKPRKIKNLKILFARLVMKPNFNISRML